MMRAVVAARAPLLSDVGFSSLKDYVLATTGLAYYQDKNEQLAHRLFMRMGALNLTRAGDYLTLLQQDPTGIRELGLLVEQLTNGETPFSRHPEDFEALQDRVMPEIAKRVGARCIRVWSAACGNGAEAYSIALLFKQLQECGTINGSVSILGTDISRRALEQAARAEYSEGDLRDTNDEFRVRCFQQRNDAWFAAPECREFVGFQYHNLVQHPFPSLLHNLCAFDMILCRNVLMYFDADTARRLVDQLHATLVEGGWLVVGDTGINRGLFAAFDTVIVSGATLYRKSNQATERRVRPIRGLVSCPAGGSEPATSPILTVPPASDLSTSLLANSECAEETERRYLKRLEEIRELANSGRLDEAETGCKSLRQERPLEAGLYLHLALIVAQKQWNEPAIELFKKALYLDPGMLVAHLHLGMLCLRMGAPQTSRKSMRHALDLLSRTAGKLVPYSDGMTVSDLHELVMQQLGMARAVAREKRRLAKC